MRTLEAHLSSQQVARVVDGAIIGLALLVVLDDHPPGAAVVVALLLGTALAVGLAELYSEALGSETRTHHPITRAELRDALLAL